MADSFEQVVASAMQGLQSGRTLVSDEVLALTVRYPSLLQCVSGKADPDMPHQRDELAQRTQLAERVIGEVERGVAALRLQMRANATLLLSPMNRIERNEQNAARNKYSLREAVLDGWLSKYPIRGNGFSYMLLGQDRRNAAASFRDGDRTMFVSEQFSAESPIDSIVACHEAVHVTQNDAVHSSITTIERARAYVDRLGFLGQQPSVVINGELPAYARELQITDSVLRGALSTNCLAEDAAMSTLGARRSDQQIVVRTLFRLARVFPGFAQHNPAYPYPDSFSNEVINLHKEYRYRVFALSSSDFLGELQTIA